MADAMDGLQAALSVPLPEGEAKAGQETTAPDPRLGYVTDLVSTLLVETESLVDQALTFGGRLRRSLLIKMMYVALNRLAGFCSWILLFVDVA